MNVISNIEKYNALKKNIDRLKEGIIESTKYLAFDKFPDRQPMVEYLLLLSFETERKLLNALTKDEPPEYISKEFTPSFKNSFNDKCLGIRQDFDSTILELKKCYAENLDLKNKTPQALTYLQGNKSGFKLFFNCSIISIYSDINRINFLEAVKKLATICQIDFQESLLCDSFDDDISTSSDESNIKFITMIFKGCNKEGIQYCYQIFHNNYYLLPNTPFPSPFFRKDITHDLFNIQHIENNKHANVIILNNNIPVAACMQEIYFNITKSKQLQKTFDDTSSIVTKTKEAIINVRKEINHNLDPNNDHNFSLIAKRNAFTDEKANICLPSLKRMASVFKPKDIPSDQFDYIFWYLYDLETEFIFSSYYSESVMSFDLNPLDGRRVSYLSQFTDASLKDFISDSLNFLSKLRVWISFNDCKLDIDLTFLSWPDKTKSTIDHCLNIDDLFQLAYEHDVLIPKPLKFEFNGYLMRTIQSKRLGFLVHPIIGEESYGLMVAERGSGKTWLALGLGYSYVTGINIFKNWKTKEKGKVLYVNGEVSHELLLDRSKTFLKMYSNKVDPAIFNNMILHTPEDEIDITTDAGQKYIETQIGNCIFKGNKKLPVSMLIFDSLLFLAENATTTLGWGKLQPWIKKLKRNHISILILHHKNKQNTSYGTIKIENFADCVLYLTKKDSTSKMLEIEIEENKNKRASDSNKDLLQLFLGHAKPKWGYKRLLNENVIYNWNAPVNIRKQQIIELQKKYNIQSIAGFYNVSKSTIEKFKYKHKLKKHK